MKFQIKVQKIICILVLITTAFAFIFSLGICTDVYNLMLTKDYGVSNEGLYDRLQDFNHNFVIICIIMIVLSLLLFVTNTNKRRKYYISNYITITIVCIIDIYFCLSSISEISSCKEIFVNNIDFEAWKEVSNIITTIRYTESTFWFDINVVMMILVIASCALLIINLVWKIMLMRYENKLLNSVEAMEVNENE